MSEQQKDQRDTRSEQASARNEQSSSGESRSMQSGHVGLSAESITVKPADLPKL